MKKLLAEVVCAAFVVTGPGQGFIFAMERSAPVVSGPVKVVAAPLAPSAIGAVRVAAPAAKAQPAATTIAQVGAVVAKVSAPGVAAGGVEAAQAVDSLYFGQTKSPVSDDGGTVLITADSVHPDFLGAPSARQSRALASVDARQARPGSSSMLVTLGVIGGVAAGGYLLRHQIMAIVNPILDRVVPAKVRYAYLLKNLEKAHDIYNAEILKVQGRYTQSETDLNDKLKEAATLQQGYLAKANEAKAAAEGSPARDAARNEAIAMKKQYDTAMEVVSTFQKRFNGNKDALKQLLERRENFFHLQATSIATVKERLDAQDNGDLEAREAAITKKYEIGASEQLDKANAKVNERIAKGKAAMDELNSSAAGQLKNAEDKARDTKARDAIDDIINGGSDKKGASQMLDPQAGKYVRPAIWLIGAIGVPVVFLAGHGLVLTAVAALVGIGMIFLKPSPALHARAADMFVIGAGSMAAGIVVAKAGSLVGLNVAMVGSMAFLFPAFVITGLSLINLVKQYREGRAQNVPGALEPIAAPSRFNPMVAIREKLAAAGKKVSETAKSGADAVAKATEKAADATTGPAAPAPAEAQPSGPSIGDSAKRAGEAAGKIVDAGKDAAGKIAGQAGDAARQGASKAADVLEKAADALQKAAGDMPAADGKGPSAAQIAERLKNVGSRLASAATKVAETAGNKVADKLEDVANGKTSVDTGAVGRIVAALKAILAMEVQKVQNLPEVRAYQMRVAASKADEALRNQILASTEKYYVAQLTAQDAQDAVAKFDKEIADLNIARHPENERSVVRLLEEKKLKELKVVEQLKYMGAYRAEMDKAVAARAMWMADAAEKLAAVQDGLTQADLADMQARLAMIAEDYVQTMKESFEAFKAEVIKRVAKSKAQEELANSNPNKALAEAEEAARKTSVEDQLAALKGAK